MKTQTFKIIFTLIITLFLSCSKNENLAPVVTEDVLPPITETGANTFGCLINGNVFIPKDKTGYTPPGGGTPKGIEVTTGSFLPTYEYFSIDIENYTGIYIYIYIPNENPNEAIYNIDESPGLRAGLNKPNFAHIFAIINNKKYISKKNLGSIIFNKSDDISKIYAGTFNIQLEDISNPSNIIEITEGRFDLNLSTLNN